MTCHRKLADCSGHYGYIPLRLPVFHIGYFRAVISVLQCICKVCSRVLLTGKSRKKHQAMMRDPRLDSVRKGVVFKAVLEVRARGVCVCVCARARSNVCVAAQP
jgi:DNA-directed RNA polymerase III subunit RPC1